MFIPTNKQEFENIIEKMTETSVSVVWRIVLEY